MFIYSVCVWRFVLICDPGLQPRLNKIVSTHQISAARAPALPGVMPSPGVPAAEPPVLHIQVPPRIPPAVPGTEAGPLIFHGFPRDWAGYFVGLCYVDKHSTINLSLHQYWWSLARQLPRTGFAPILCVAFDGLGLCRMWLDEPVQEKAPEWELT